MFGNNANNNNNSSGDGGGDSNNNNMITPRNSSTTELPFPEHAQAPGGSGSKQQQRTQEAQQQQRRLVEYFLVVSSEPTKTPEAHEADILREEDNEDEDDVEDREYSFYTFGNRTASAPTTISRTASMDAAGADDRSYASGKSGNKSTSNNAAAASAAAAAAAQQQLLHQRPAYSNDSMTFEQSFRDEWQTDFVPQISGRYPLLDHVDNPLEESVTWFCAPSGQIVPLEEAQMPKVHFFVTTGSRGQLMYGTCLTLWESYTLSKKKRMFQDDGMPIETQVSIEVYLPKVLCLLSAWPFLTAFREFLTQLYRLSKSCTMTVPLERYVVNFCAEIPAPPPGAFEVQATIGESVIKLWSPPHNQPIPWVSLPFAHLFQCLDVTHVMLVWHALTLERQVLLTSTQLSLLTTCSEILLSLLFPMTWSHAYIPVLPPFMIPILGAPMPYLCGINKSNLSNALGDLSPEAIVVDLDKNVVSMGPQTPPLPALPQPLWQSVRQTLEESAGMVFREVRCLSRNYDATDMGQHLPPHLKDMADAAWEATLCLSDEAFHLYYTPEESRKNWLNGDAPDFSYSSADTMDGNVPLHIRVMTKAERSKLKKQSNWDAVQEAFFGIYLYMLRNYRKFLVFPTKKSLGGDEEDSTPASQEYTYDGGGFQTQPFVRSQKFDMQPFLRELCQTQLFDNFVTKRLYNSGESDVLFVDHAIHTLYGNQTLLKQAGQALTPGAPQARKGLQQVGARFRRGNNSSDRGSNHKRSSSSTDASGSSRLLGGMGSLHGTLGKDVHAEPLLQSAAIRRKLKTVVPPEPTGYELPKPPPQEMRDAIQEYRLSEEGRETAGHVQHHDDDISVISTSSAGSYSLRSGRSGAARSTSDVTKPQEHRRTGSAGYYSARQRQEDETLYYYPKFPSSLDPELFGDPRPLSSAILAEFERQRADAIRFRRKRTHYTDEGALTDPSATTNLRQSSSRRLLSMTHDGSTNSSDPFGQELHPFPEVATFSLFFQAFTALIGKELIEVAERPTYTDKDFIVSTFDYQKLKKEKAAKEAAAAAAAAESEEDTTTAAATVSTLDHEEEEDDEDSPTTVDDDDVPTLSSPPRVLKQEKDSVVKDDGDDAAHDEDDGVDSDDVARTIPTEDEKEKAERTLVKDDEDANEGKTIDDDENAQKGECSPTEDDDEDDKNKGDVVVAVADDNDQDEANVKSDSNDNDEGAYPVDAISSQDTTTNATSFDVGDALVVSDSNDDAQHKLNVSAISGSSSSDDDEEHTTDFGGATALTKSTTSTTNKFESTYFNESGRDRVSTRLRIRPSTSDDDDDDEEDISPSLRKGASFRFRSTQKARPRLGSYNSDDDDIYDDDVDLYRDDYDNDASSFGGRRGPSKLDMFTKNLDTSFGMNELTAGGLVPAPDDPLVVGDSADGDDSGASGQASASSSDDDDDDVKDDDTGERPKKWYDGVAGDYEDDNEVVPPLEEEEVDTSDMALATAASTTTDAAGSSSSKDVETNDTEITPVTDKADDNKKDHDDKLDEDGDTTDDAAKTCDKNEKATKEAVDTKDDGAAESAKDVSTTNKNDTVQKEKDKCDDDDDDDDDSHYKVVKLTQSQTTDEEGLEVELNPSSSQEDDDNNDNEEDDGDNDNDNEDNDDNGNDDEDKDDKDKDDDENETKDDETKKDEEKDLESKSNVVEEVALDGKPKKEDAASTVPEKGETTKMAPPTHDKEQTKSEEANKNKDDDATADDEACPEVDHPPPPPPPEDDDEDDDNDVPNAADVAPPIVVTDSAEAMALIGSPDRSGGRHVPSLTITTSTSSDGPKSSSAQMADAEEYLENSQRRVRSLVKTVSERALPLGKRIGEASGPVVKTVSERALLSPLGKRFSKLSRNKSETSGMASNDVSSILRSSAPPGTTSIKSSSERSVKSTSLVSVKDGARSRFTDKLTVLELEEAKATAKAQLGLAFDILQMMRERGLKADPSVYQSLIGACGRCGDTERATQLLGRMHEDGIVADGVVYACLVSAFSQENAYKKKLGLQPNKANMPEWANNVTTLDMDWNSLRKRQSVAQAAKKHFQDVSQRIRQGLDEEIDDEDDDLDASDGNFGSTTTAGGARDRSVSPKKRKNLGMARFRKRSGNVINSLRGKTKGKGGKKDDDITSASSSTTGGPPNSQKDELMVTEPVLMQLLLGENLLELVYPDILIEMDTETCPRCSSRLTDQDIVRGWKSADAQNYTTKCPSCYQRFVPHFSVQSSSPDFVGSRGPDTPLFCQRLSPWVLQKELRTVMMSSQMGNNATTSSIFRDEFLSKEWRHKETRNATLWWNLVVSFMRYRLPITFLLQDNFVGTSLIAPTPSFEDVEPLQPVHHATPPQATTNNCNDTVGGESKASGQFTASTMETSSTL